MTAGGEGELRWSCEVTAVFLDAAERDLRAALLGRHDLLAPLHRERRRRLLPPLRWLGLGVAGLGIGLAGYVIAVVPGAPGDGGPLLRIHLFQVAFVLAAVLFWFLPRLEGPLQAWARRRVEGQAGRLLAPLRRRAPYRVEYRLAGARLETRAEKLGLRRTTALRGVAAAALAPSLACLYRTPASSWLRRVVYFDAPEPRAAFGEALRREGVEVLEVVR